MNWLYELFAISPSPSEFYKYLIGCETKPQSKSDSNHQYFFSSDTSSLLCHHAPNSTVHSVLSAAVKYNVEEEQLRFLGKTFRLWNWRALTLPLCTGHEKYIHTWLLQLYLKEDKACDLLHITLQKGVQQGTCNTVSYKKKITRNIKYQIATCVLSFG